MAMSFECKALKNPRLKRGQIGKGFASSTHDGPMERDPG